MQKTSTVQWDAWGNLTGFGDVGPTLPAKSYEWTDQDRLRAAVDVASGTTTRYAYDSSGERVLAWKTDATGELIDATFHIRDEEGRVLSDWLHLGDLMVLSRDYVYGPSGAVAQVEWAGIDPAVTYLAADHLGSTRYTYSDALGGEEVDYHPFGTLSTPDPSPETTHLFTGHERDLASTGSGLDYMHARYYSPGMGRFLSVDPVGGSVGGVRGGTGMRMWRTIRVLFSIRMGLSE